MPDGYPLALRLADQARTDFAIIETELEAIHARLAQLPARGLSWRALRSGSSTGLVIDWIEVFWR